MFKNFFLLELKYTLKQPMVYIMLLLMTLMVFAATVSDNLQIGGSIGNIYRNSPYTITLYTTIMTMIGLMIATAFFNNAALRDHNNDFNKILFSTPLSKSGYFFGRFLGALVLTTIPMLGIFLGSILGTLLAPVFGWMDTDRFGDFHLETFINNYFLFIIPNMFFAGAIIYSMAHKWKSTAISFVGALLIIVTYIVSGTLTSDIDNETIAALTDAFGIRTYSVDTKYFTPVEKNTISPGFNGILLQNRLLWTGIGILILLLSYFSFSFKEKRKKVEKKNNKDVVSETVFSLPKMNTHFSGRTEWIQFKSFFYINFLSILKSVTFKILFLFSAIILVSDLAGGYEYFGLKSYPLTYKLVDSINDNTTIYTIIILVFFSGELVWRDRESKINEVIDATAHNTIVSMTAKALSLISITIILQSFFIFCGIIYQLVNGYTRIELDVYLLDFVYSNLPIYIIWSGVMIMIQVLFSNKYIGYFVSILVIFILGLLLKIFDIESNMLVIGARPSLEYSDMNAFGPGVKGAFWFGIYWILFSFLCLLLAGALWNRGVLSPLIDRIKVAKKQIPKKYGFIMAITAISWMIVAGFVYYNTQILNSYKTFDELEVLSAAYEKKFKKHENVKLPKITDIQYFIDIFPQQRNVDSKAIIELTNEHDVAIDSLHFNINKAWITTFDIPQSKLIFEDEDLGYLIYKLDTPLLPSQSITIEINNIYETKGFTNNRGNTKVVNNGTFLNNFEILPILGYNKSSELSDNSIRKKYDLPPKERAPKLQKEPNHHHMNNYLSNGRSDFIDVETTISTSKDQVAIAPGSLIKKWTENERNYYHYKIDQPSQNFYSFISADYEIATRKWNGIDIEVYYDSKHDWNVEMMLDAVQRSLEYYTKNFGPYYHKQCRIIEFPRYASFAQAFPGTMPYSEAIGFVIDLEDSPDNNVVDAVIAHEMGHQWWAHQVIGANMQGSTMISESFAEYSSLMTLKSLAETPIKMRKFLKYDHDRYLKGRSKEIEKELPLYKVENQSYIHYGKGSVVLYALQDYIGEDKVNEAMKEFLNQHKYKKPPYPSSLDFIECLEAKVPDSLNYLITDWFKEITLYDNRIKESSYKKLDNGKYEIVMMVESYKIKADSLGNETRVPINDWIDIGVFADQAEKQLVYEKRVKLNQNETNFTFQIDSKPLKVAIDPRKLLIDRVYDDNVKSIQER